MQHREEMYNSHDCATVWGITNRRTKMTNGKICSEWCSDAHFRVYIFCRWSSVLKWLNEFSHDARLRGSVLAQSRSCWSVQTVLGLRLRLFFSLSFHLIYSNNARSTAHYSPIKHWKAAGIRHSLSSHSSNNPNRISRRTTNKYTR